MLWLVSEGASHFGQMDPLSCICMWVYVHADTYVYKHTCMWYMRQRAYLYALALTCLQMPKVDVRIINLFYLICWGRVSQSTAELADITSLASSLLWGSPAFTFWGWNNRWAFAWVLGIHILVLHASVASILFGELPTPRPFQHSLNPVEFVVILWWF